MLTKKHCQCRLFLSVIGRSKENYENSRKFEGVIKESTIEGLVGMHDSRVQDEHPHAWVFSSPERRLPAEEGPVFHSIFL